MNLDHTFVSNLTYISSSSTFVGCQGVPCCAQLFGSPRCSRGLTNGTRQTSTWSIQQSHTDISFRAYLTWYLPRTRARLVYVDTHPQPHQARPQDGYARHHMETLAGAVSLLIIFAYIYINIHKIIHVFLTVPLLNGCSFAFAT